MLGHGAHVTGLPLPWLVPPTLALHGSPSLPHPSVSASQPCQALPTPSFPTNPTSCCSGLLQPTLEYMTTVRAKERLLAVSIFHTNFPRGLGGESAGLSPLELGEGRIQGEKKSINQPFCPYPPHPPPPHDLTPLHPLCFVLHRWPRGTGKLILRWSFSPSGPPLSTQSCSGADVALRSTSDCRAGAGGEGGMGGPNAEEAPSPPVEQATGACFPSLGLAFPGRNMQTDGGSGPRMSANQKGAPLPVRAWRWAEEVPVLDIWNHQNGV